MYKTAGLKPDVLIFMIIIGRQKFLKIDSILPCSHLNRRKMRVIGTTSSGGSCSTRGTIGERDGMKKTEYCRWKIGRGLFYGLSVNDRASSRSEDALRLDVVKRVETAVLVQHDAEQKGGGRTMLHRLVARPLSQVVFGLRLHSAGLGTPFAMRSLARVSVG